MNSQLRKNALSSKLYKIIQNYIQSYIFIKIIQPPYDIASMEIYENLLNFFNHFNKFTYRKYMKNYKKQSLNRFIY